MAPCGRCWSRNGSSFPGLHVSTTPAHPWTDAAISSLLVGQQLAWVTPGGDGDVGSTTPMGAVKSS